MHDNARLMTLAAESTRGFQSSGQVLSNEETAVRATGNFVPIRSIDRIDLLKPFLHSAQPESPAVTSSEFFLPDISSLEEGRFGPQSRPITNKDIAEMKAMMRPPLAGLGCLLFSAKGSRSQRVFCRCCGNSHEFGHVSPFFWYFPE